MDGSIGVPLDHECFTAMMADEAEMLGRARDHALRFLTGLSERPVDATASPDPSRTACDDAFGEAPVVPANVLDSLIRDVDPGLLATNAGRFFGWAIGGTLPVATAADWLTSALDRNDASHALRPAEAVVEEICGTWLKDLLALPASSSFALVTGCDMAHATALSIARHSLLRDRGFGAEADGLSGSPPVRVLIGDHRQEDIEHAAKRLGLGIDGMERIPCEPGGAMRMDSLAAALRIDPERPTIVCLQAGDADAGAYDAFEPACRLSRSVGAWVHVDGTLGLWAAASDRRRHLLHGVGGAHSWATDGHKWLNLPYDVGFVFTAIPEPHVSAASQHISYGPIVDASRRALNGGSEWSRRGRSFAVYAALRALGRRGIASLVDRCSDFTTILVDGLSELPGVEVLARPQMNQGLVRFIAADGRHDRYTDAVISRIQATGGPWFGGTTWQGMRAMRISVSNCRTTPDEIARTLIAVKRGLQVID